ncbi:uncharacterized protein BDR25DRAFT_303482 [Lindgomyces ingoldianus]|uniref:Uncharacterized protein n=1 Tax=Lindgomyces ingoldianus TaxID=673940 RepID=A0ACB6QUZ2_9PLEO|nr:uncharacterized protein BDR25DRAFT_303482 [Lindgomyces ingoldianus]KAF2470854.1 hypothetical protein BDR25DRAFT_303482 [Lindgomyces ingoldianus]
MPQTIALEFESDPSLDGTLHGKDFGEYLAKGKRGGVRYEVTSYIAVHGHMMVNDKKEKASLLVYKVVAVASRARPISKLEVELVFRKKAAAKADPDPRLLKTCPGERGFKLECKQGSAKFKSHRGSKFGVKVGADMAHAEGGFEGSREQELDQPLEFYALATGTRHSSTQRGRTPNAGLWTFEASGPVKGSIVKNGVPPVCHIVAILIRPWEDEFICNAKVHVEVDKTWALANSLPMWWDSVFSEPMTYDPEENEQAEEPIPPETLDEYKSEDKLKDLVEIQFPQNYVDWKFGKVQHDDEDVEE